jgi:hypothetical protein
MTVRKTAIPLDLSIHQRWIPIGALGRPSAGHQLELFSAGGKEKA